MLQLLASLCHDTSLWAEKLRGLQVHPKKSSKKNSAAFDRQKFIGSVQIFRCSPTITIICITKRFQPLCIPAGHQRRQLSNSSPQGHVSF